MLAVTSIFRFGEDANIQPAYFSVVLMPILLVLLLFGRARQVEVRPVHYLFIVLYGCFFLRNAVEYGIWQSSNLLSAVFFWPAAAAFVLSISVLFNKTDWELLLNYLTICLILSSGIALYQFVTEFPVRAHGISGTENHLALQIVHVLLLAAILRVRGWRFHLLGLAGFTTLSRGFILFQFIRLSVGMRWFKLPYLLSLIGVGVVLALVFGDVVVEAADNPYISSRFEFGDNPSDRDGRGLIRTLIYPEYFLYGASEAVRDFVGDPFYGQIHNNFISLSFCFGFPGIIFSLVFLIILFSRAGLAIALAYVAFSFGFYFYTNIIFLIVTAALLSKNE